MIPGAPEYSGRAMKRLLIVALVFLSTAVLAKDKSQISLDALAVTVPDRSYAYVVLPKGQYVMLRCNSFDRNCSRGLMPGTYTADTDGKWFWIHNELRPIKYHRAKTKSARLYNLQSAEVSRFDYTENGSGKGVIIGELTSGERLHGEYVTVAGGDMSWGTVYGNVYGSRGYGSGSANAFTQSIEGKQRGTGIVTGEKGTILECEYLTSAWTGGGNGACTDNRGNKYKVLF